MARIPELRRGQVFDLLFQSECFEHWAKERCLLPGSSFANYRAHVGSQPWMRMPARYRELSEDAIDAVFAEVEALGERTAAGLSARGELGESSNVVWKSTTRVTTMALRVLWTRCRLVVSGRTGTTKRYDTPERSLPRGSRGEGTKDFARWALLERVEAAGLLSMRAGPWWGTTGTARKSGLVQELVEAGQLTAVRIDGAKTIYLAPRDWRERHSGADHADDGKVRILAPLDPLIWDRRLVHHVFDFEYTWEVYKPEEKRIWGYYVCPLLRNGEIIGRFEGRVDAGELQQVGLWRESPRFDDKAWRAAFDAHAARVRS